MKLIELFSAYDAPSYYFDQDDKLITRIHANDASWRSEYFDPILKHFGVNGTDTITYDSGKLSAHAKRLLKLAKAEYPEDFE